MTPTLLACCFFLQSPTPEVIEHAQAGAAAAQQGRLSVAIQEFRKVTELQPESAAGHARLGDAYFQNGDYGAAIPELELALRLSPNLNDTHQTLGVVLLIQGNPEAALPHLEKMRTPELLGLAYLETGRLGGAIAALHAALDKQPNDPNLLYYFGRATALASKRSSNQLAKLNSDAAAPPRTTRAGRLKTSLACKTRSQRTQTIETCFPPSAGRRRRLPKKHSIESCNRTPTRRGRIRSWPNGTLRAAAFPKRNANTSNRCG